MAGPGLGRRELGNKENESDARTSLRDDREKVGALAGPPHLHPWAAAPPGPVPRAWQTTVGPGTGMWGDVFPGEVSGDTPELDLPVLTLAWSLNGSFILQPRRPGARLRPTHLCFSSCCRVLAYSLKALRLFRLEEGKYVMALCKIPNDSLLWMRFILPKARCSSRKRRGQ